MRGAICDVCHVPGECARARDSLNCSDEEWNELSQKTNMCAQGADAPVYISSVALLPDTARHLTARYDMPSRLKLSSFARVRPKVPPFALPQFIHYNTLVVEHAVSRTGSRPYMRSVSSARRHRHETAGSEPEDLLDFLSSETIYYQWEMAHAPEQTRSLTNHRTN